MVMASRSVMRRARMGQHAVARRIGSNQKLFKLLWDANNASLMTFRPTRQLKAASSQYFRRQIAAPFTFQGTNSQFTISCWIRHDATSFPASEVSLFGLSGSSNLSWLIHMTSAGGIHFWWGNTSTGAFAGQITCSGSPFQNASPSNLFQCWTHLLIVYDGSKHGTDSNVFRIYVNGASSPSVTGGAGSSLPQVLGNATDGTQQLTIGGRGFAGEYNDWSIDNIGICSGVPANNATAAADLYNNGVGVDKAHWPASCPSLLAYYAGNDNASGTTAPSGDLVDTGGGGYNLTAMNSPGGALEIVDWYDQVLNLRLQFGYNPVTGYRQRLYEAEYLPNGRGTGKPGVRLYGQRAFNGISYDVGNSYGYAKFDGTSLGVGGSMFSSAVFNVLGRGENDYFGFFDDETGLGAGGDTRRFLTMNAIGDTNGQNSNLDSTANGRRFPNLHIHSAVGSPLVYTMGPGDVNNLDGEETTGHYVVGNTYIQADGSTQYAVELCNKNDGTLGTQSTPGPYEIYVNNAKQSIFVGDGGQPSMQKTWGASYPKLTAVMLGGYSEVVSGTWSPSHAMDAVFGVVGVSPVLSATKRAAVRAWIAGR